MKKKIPVLFGIHTWVPVPCYENGLGSCIIEDICDTSKLNFGKCPKAFEEQDITCKCPILKVTEQHIKYHKHVCLFRLVLKNTYEKIQ